MNNFFQSPLPFQGQKRRFIKHFRASVSDFPATATYIDLFGGSGLLAHNVKQVHPHARVIYNDYDDFSARLATIQHTNRMLKELRNILADYPRGKRIAEPLRSSVLDYIRLQNESYMVDYITLSASLLFSANYAINYKDFAKETLYNKIRKTDYDAAGYLSGVQVVRKDYKQLFDEYKSGVDVVFLVDPPYLSTDSATYGSDGYWKLQDYLDVLQVIKQNSYFYFTSNKSQIVELCEWISSVSTTANPFEFATCATVSNSVNYNSKYTDIMYYLKK